jgi:RNA polymerase sigma-70 factor (ECF subfamily)
METPGRPSGASNYPIRRRKPDIHFFGVVRSHVTHDTSVELWRRYSSADADAAEAIHARYAERLLALARRRISQRLGRRIDADDVAQSAWRSFFVRGRGGAFRIERSGDLWRLLATITVKKVLGQAELHRSQMRDVHREWAPPAELLEQIAGGPSPDEIAAAGDLLQSMLSRLSAEQRAALEMRLEEFTYEEIARRIGRTERTVRRWLKEVREWMEEVASEEEDSLDAD